MELSQEVVDAILEAAEEQDGRRRLSCSQAFYIAERFSVNVRLIGQYCTDEDIKLVNCQLGCF